jgi:hypothetical protein
MKILRTLTRKRFYAYALGIIVATGVLAANSFTSPTSAQATDSIYLTPGSGSYAVGSNFTVTVRENSGSQVNAAEADLSYSTAYLEFVSIDASGSAFGIDASSTGGNGSVSIARGNTSPVSGDQLVAKVTFKALLAGPANVTMQNNSVVLSSSTNSNVVTTRNGGSFTLTSAVSPSPSPSPTPTPAPTPSPTPTPTTKPSPTPTTKPATNSTVSVAPNGNSQSTPLPGDSTIELNAPATVQTTPGVDKDVTKVEYYVNGKLVATVDKTPYSYSVDTTKYRNGKYTLTTKTYYKSGKIDSSNAALVVKNPYSSRQFFLQLRHYAWLVIIALLIVGELLWMRFFKHRSFKNPYGGAGTGTGFGGIGGGTTPTSTGGGSTGKPNVVVGGTPSVVVEPKTAV